MSALIAAGGIGGIVAFVGAVWILARGIFAQVAATKDNTDTLRDLAKDFKNLNGRVVYIEGHLGIRQTQGSNNSDG
jgi:hypothetical protein